MDVKKQILQIYKITKYRNKCFFCLSTTDDIWCNNCETDIIRQTQRCTQCAKPCEYSEFCGNCVNSPPVYTRTTVLFNYDYPAKKLIHEFKFKKRAELSVFFADRLSNKIKNQKALPEILIPVPLHRKRQLVRGYNQSMELAKHLSSRLNIPLNSKLCERIVNTDPQSKLSKKSRKKNVKNAFSLSNNKVSKHIAIIDDVITTGATINEIATTFKKAGCEQIDVWAIAKT